MQKLLDKLILLLVTSIFYLSIQLNIYSILFILVSITLTCIHTYYEDEKIRVPLEIVFFILCILYYQYLFFLPLLVYDRFHKKSQFFLLFYLLLFILHSQNLELISILTIFFFMALSYFLQGKSNLIISLTIQNQKIKDDSEELKIIQENKQKELLEKQDYEIQLAKAEERNRIAREIHDSVGHNLSSSLLQIGAMIALNQDEKLKEPLDNMKNTLSEGMDSIRRSVHDLHEDSLNLEKEMKKIIDQFTFCETTFKCHITNLMDMKLKYCFINILKEALNNVIKHSNASHVHISFMETPAFYQFIIQDNGNNIHMKDGLGLKSMQERVENYQGICRFIQDEGFKIFINIPKEVAV